MNTQKLSNNIGIDTFKLHLPIKIKPEAISSNIISINQSSNKALNCIKHYTNKGEIIEASGYRHIENKRFQVNFKPEGDITIQASIPKLNNKPCELLGVRENKLAFEELLDNVSMFADFSKKDVKNSRIDLTRNIELEKPFENYNVLFKAVPSKCKGYSFQNTHTFFNKQIAHCIYDKIQEIKDKKQDIPEHLKGCNIARNEIRFQKKSKLRDISKITGVNCTEPEVYLNQDYFNKLKEYYYIQTDRHLKYMTEIIDYNKISHIELILEAKQKNIPLKHCMQKLGTTFVSLDEQVNLYYPESKQARYQFKNIFMKQEKKYYAKTFSIKTSEYKGLLDEFKSKALLRVA